MWKFPLCSYHFPPSSPPSVFLSCEWRQWLRLRMGLCILLQNTAALVIHSTALLSSVHTPTLNGLMLDKLLVKNSSKWLTNNLTTCRKVVLNSISTFTLCRSPCWFVEMTSVAAGIWYWPPDLFSMLAALHLFSYPRWITSCSPDCFHIKRLLNCRATVLICTFLFPILIVLTKKMNVQLNLKWPWFWVKLHTLILGTLYPFSHSCSQFPEAF